MLPKPVAFPPQARYSAQTILDRLHYQESQLLQIQEMLASLLASCRWRQTEEGVKEDPEEGTLSRGPFLWMPWVTGIFLFYSQLPFRRKGGQYAFNSQGGSYDPNWWKREDGEED